MYLKIGNYTHPIGEPALQIGKRPVLSEGGIPLSIIETWLINGLIVGSGQADIDAKVAALVSAYSQRNFDAVLLLSDGATASQHVMRHRDSMGGIRVIAGPSFPNGGGAEYATKRTFSVTLEAEFPEAAATSLLSFRESVTFGGGGPRTAWTETKLGPPRPQLVRRQTIYRATQSGQAVGYRVYPTFPGLLLPERYALEPPSLTYGGGKNRGNGLFTDYTLSWEVRYQSDRPLVATPHLR
ncbi:hypothetical protein [Blastopirellula retiformator]|uniref:Uncharacterized protein n=1 Tax=Blastopirellula retiformator TaxID=2527970 RepID=A0A5C5UWJ6_9BACT|nr:hypothetical protein [Blastopirellula retiformator]TWT30721.1 hypothetical protein Enr8_42440 [Blastopirellula retiformator]